MNTCLTLLLLSSIPSAPALGSPKFASFDDVIAALQNKNVDRRLDAIDYLREEGDYRLNNLDALILGPVADELLNRLGDEVEKVRDGALKLLEAMQGKKRLSETQRTKLASMLPPLFKSKTRTVRLDAAKLLIAVKPESLRSRFPLRDHGGED